MRNYVRDTAIGLLILLFLLKMSQTNLFEVVVLVTGVAIVNILSFISQKHRIENEDTKKETY